MDLAQAKAMTFFVRKDEDGLREDDDGLGSWLSQRWGLDWEVR
jgi:hypothetical protein